ncbi:MAG: acyl-CoA dehydrogenase family protein, partial [Thermoleophilia bacterium]|nr:acyl-CoA dehydrogenase family protein [Thermoleophilia bacterium]
MNFALNDEQLAFKERCRRFAREVIRPAAPIHDADESVPWEVMRQARAQGMSGLALLERTAADPDGQLGLIHAEELHWGCA